MRYIYYKLIRVVVYGRVIFKQSTHLRQQITRLLNERELTGAQGVVVAREAFGEKGANRLDNGLSALDVLRL